jgi:hypothetical protein
VKKLTITLSEEMFNELSIAAVDSAELDENDAPTPAIFARECVESVLASRRLERIAFSQS